MHLIFHYFINSEPVINFKVYINYTNTNAILINILKQNVTRGSSLCLLQHDGITTTKIN